MTDEEKMLFERATPAAQRLMKEASKLQRNKRRLEWKQAQIKQTQLQAVPAQTAFAVRPDKADRE
jgi:hypothetical protein